MVRDLAPAETPPNLISAVPSLERLGPEGGRPGDGASVIALGAGRRGNREITRLIDPAMGGQGSRSTLLARPD
jgi:hypothetical protein